LKKITRLLKLGKKMKTLPAKAPRRERGVIAALREIFVIQLSRLAGCDTELNTVAAVQECDATMLNSRTKAKDKIIIILP
jgi:hypothetical protein